VNPQPGKQGTLGLATVESLGIYRFDANLSKAFRIDEKKSVQIRVDATNVLNHPQIGELSINNYEEKIMRDIDFHMSGEDRGVQLCDFSHQEQR
jgi:hypothetical protein